MIAQTLGSAATRVRRRPYLWLLVLPVAFIATHPHEVYGAAKTALGHLHNTHLVQYMEQLSLGFGCFG